MPGKLDLSRLLETAGAHRAATGAAVGALVLLCGAALYLGLGSDDATEPPQQAVAPAPRAAGARAAAAAGGARAGADPARRERRIRAGACCRPSRSTRGWRHGSSRTIWCAGSSSRSTTWRTAPTRRAHVPFMRPRNRIRTREDGSARRLDPAGYRRYDELARIVASLDVEGAVEIYRRLEPLLDEAYVELGYPDTPFAVAFPARGGARAGDAGDSGRSRRGSGRVVLCARRRPTRGTPPGAEAAPS